MTREITLTQGQVALVDDEDYKRVAAFKWCALWNPRTKSFYAGRHIRKSDGTRTTQSMHRYLIGVGVGVMIDHRNHDTLDNTRGNLRRCSDSQNKYNSRKHTSTSSKYKGVSLHKRSKKWEARIAQSYDGVTERYYLGSFDTELDAAIAYDNAALHRFGVFVCPNFDWSDLNTAVPSPSLSLAVT